MAGAVCRSCHASVTWARTESGKAMPIDPDPVANGNLVLTGRTVKGMPEVHALKATDDPGSRARWTSHFATCPDAPRHRKRR